MEDANQTGQSVLSAPGKFDNLLKAFDIRDVGSSSEEKGDAAKSPSKSTRQRNGSDNNGVVLDVEVSTVHKEISKSLNSSMTSTASSGSPGRLKIDEGHLKSDLDSSVTVTTAPPKAARQKVAPVKRTRSAAAKNAVPLPVVSIKEEKEDHGYNNAMKNVITMTTPSPILTTSVPVSSISLLTGNVISKSPLLTSTPPGRQGPKSLISPSSATQLKIAPRPSAQANNPAKFAFIPASTSNPRGPGSKTVTLYVPPNLLTTSGAGGAIRLPSPQSLMELLSKSGQAITSRPTVRPAVTMQSAQPVNQAGLVNPHPRISSKVAVTPKPPGPATGPRMPVSASGPTPAPASNVASRDVLVKMLQRDRFPSRRITMPPADLNYGTVTKHICACGDEFLSAANLEIHIARKSAIIRVICQFCPHNQNQMFFNPCALVFHIQAHRRTVPEFLKGLVSCQVSPIGKKTTPDAIPVECIDLSKESEMTQKNLAPKQPAQKAAESKEPIDIDADDKEREKTPPSSDPVSVNTTPEKRRDSNEINHDHGNDEEQTSISSVAAAEREREESKYDSCPFCKILLEKGTALEHHFQTAQSTQTDEVNEYICSECNRQLPNPCSYQAHRAFHNKTRPYVCPECGETINGSLETYLKHVQDKCMHNMHFLRFGCTKCPKKKKKFSTRKQLLEHIENHGETYVKCLHCPMAFRSMETLKDHCAKTHVISDVTDTDYKSIFKCALCDTVYQEAEQRRSHLATHNKDLRVFLVYRCNKMNCGANRIFITKVRIREHLATAHGLEVLIHLCNYCGQHFDTADMLTEHLKSHSNPNQCVFCGEVCSDQRMLWKHLIQNHDNAPVTETPKARSPVIMRKRTSSSDPAGSPAAKRVKSPPYVPSCQVEAAEDSRFYCSDCKLKFLRQGVLQEHMRIVHSVQPQFPCHLCGATYDSHSKLQKHVKQHEGKAKEQVYFVCWICSKNKNLKLSKYTKRTILEKHLTSYHKLNKSQIDWSNLKTSGSLSDAGSEGEGEGSRETEVVEDDEPIKRLKVDGDTQFTCAKCTFVCENREEFLSHIPQHKTEDESHQCQECGMCFMVLPSLKRHLLVVHRIRDFMKYFKESGLNLETPPIEEKTKAPMRPKFPLNGNSEHKAVVDFGDIDIPDDFECKVCYKQFDSEKALHNHMRVHGMAFIRSKRMDSS